MIFDSHQAGIWGAKVCWNYHSIYVRRVIALAQFRRCAAEGSFRMVDQVRDRILEIPQRADRRYVTAG